MNILIYNDLAYGKLKKQVEKVVSFLKSGDFKSADVKKMVNTGFYRAKLDDTNRLLFKYTQIGDKKYVLILEVIHNHAYEKSRFLNGASIDESKLPDVKTEQDLVEEETNKVSYINEKQKTFHILDKIISFDEVQDEILHFNPPIIIIGSAGSGKTALTLEKLKTLQGRILYVTLSSYLVENSQNLYYSFGYENEKQEVDFLSFQDYLGSIEVPQGKEIDFKTFEQWIWRFKQSHKVKDTYKIYEEFKGVMTGTIIDKPYLSKEDYLNLGVKQSIFLAQERESVYDLFTRYLDFLQEGNYYDSNLVAYHHLSQITPTYDFVVVDEVQDITNVQLYSILKSLYLPTNFILCGDSNQIVHPNFFSWANVKTLFYKQELKGNIIRVLASNYRNTPEVTNIANQLLLVKNARFGSIDRESTYLVKSISQHKGQVQFLENVTKNKQDLNQRTRKSAKFAVIVMRNEDKIEAHKHFDTPLIFSIHEVKGLEYENIILYNIISAYEKEFREICNGVNKADLEADMNYGRAKDKTDKSLDEYKFYINSLYVAITRAIKNLYVLETNKKHALLELLNLTNFSTQVNLKEQVSTSEDWQREARKLELQGKQEQADAIRENVLKIKQVPWPIITKEILEDAKRKAFDPELFNKKAKDAIYEYALFQDLPCFMEKLSALKYRPADADRWPKEQKILQNKILQNYTKDDVKSVKLLTEKYGVDFRNEVNCTPLMMAVRTNAVKIFQYLIENGAKTDLLESANLSALNLSFPQNQMEMLPNKVVRLNNFYTALRPESITLKIQNRSFKIYSHQGEYLMLQLMLSMWRNQILNQVIITADNWTFETSSFLPVYEMLNSQILADYRKKRTYISSILSKNEINSGNKYGKKLWARYKQGYYVPNPLLEIRIADEWHFVYDIVNIKDVFDQKINFPEPEVKNFWFASEEPNNILNLMNEQTILKFNEYIEKLKQNILNGNEAIYDALDEEDIK